MPVLNVVGMGTFAVQQSQSLGGRRMVTNNKGIDAIVQAALTQVVADNIKAPWFDYAIRRLDGQLQALH